MNFLIVLLFLLFLSPGIFAGSSHEPSPCSVRGTPGEILWTGSVEGGIYGMAAIHGNEIYIGSHLDGKKIYAFRDDGMLLWESEIGVSVESAPAVSANGTLYVNGVNLSEDNNGSERYQGYGIDELQGTIAVDPTDGSIFWADDSVSGSDSSPAIDNSRNRVYLGVVYNIKLPEEARFGKKIYALNALNGLIEWEFDINGWSFCSPALSALDGRIYTGSANPTLEGTGFDGKGGTGDFWAIDVDGHLQWHVTDQSAFDRSPIVYYENGQEYILAGTQRGSFFKFDREGNILWKTDLDVEGFASLVLSSDNTKMFTTTDSSGNAEYADKLLAMDVSSGEVLWKTDLVRGTTPAVGDKALYVADGIGNFHAFDEEGDELWSVNLGETVAQASVTLNECGIATIGSEKGTFFAIQTESRSLSPLSQWPKYRGDIKNSGMALGFGLTNGAEDIPEEIPDNEEDLPDAPDSSESTETNPTSGGCSLDDEMRPLKRMAQTTHCAGADTDGDDVCDISDNCPVVSNADQGDIDGDGTGDECDDDKDGDLVSNINDNCPVLSNADQTDTDGDDEGDPCDLDDDGDGMIDPGDNCPLISNAAQVDSDGDDIGDACDDDDDQDGVDDMDDNCPDKPNNSQADTDGDDNGDSCDADKDEDGVVNNLDNCALTSNADQADDDGDDVGNACEDQDGDGILFGQDNCPFFINVDQTDTDGDGAGDVCDVDRDGDGLVNAVDNCSYVPNDQTDSDGDGIGDSCEDSDADGIAAESDNCPDFANPDQEDFDGDGDGNACDPDTDGDGLNNSGDNCPAIPNADQTDSDGDGFGDVCEDVDGDGVTAETDNCFGLSNADQADTDGDGEGDACDTDDDADSIDDTVDICSGVADSDQADTDGDGIGDSCDPEDNSVDADGEEDEDEDIAPDENPIPEEPDEEEPSGNKATSGGGGCRLNPKAQGDEIFLRRVRVLDRLPDFDQTGFPHPRLEIPGFSLKRFSIHKDIGINSNVHASDVFGLIQSPFQVSGMLGGNNESDALLSDNTGEIQ